MQPAQCFKLVFTTIIFHQSNELSQTLILNFKLQKGNNIKFDQAVDSMIKC